MSSNVMSPPSRKISLTNLKGIFRHLLKKPLAALPLLLLLAACGGGSGGSSQAITEQPQPQPPGPITGPAVTSSVDQGGEDGQEQQTIIVQQQPEDEPENDESDEPENDESEENEDQEILTIIEEPSYVPPEKSEPQYSASTATTATSTLDPNRFNNNENYDPKTYEAIGSIGSFSYWMQDAPGDRYRQIIIASKGIRERNFDVSIFSRNSLLSLEGRGPRSVCDPPSSIVPSDCQTVNDFKFPTPTNKNIVARYHRSNGFVGTYYYYGETGNFASDVDLTFRHNYRSGSVYIDGYIGRNITMGSSLNSDADIPRISVGFPMTISVDTSTGTFTHDEPYFGYWINVGAGKMNDNVREHGTGTIIFAFSKDGSDGNAKENLPNHLAGEVRIEKFATVNPENSSHNRLVGRLRC